MTAGHKRPAFSHVDRAGNPKKVYETERAATIAVARLEADTGDRFDWYVCSQRPEHWHLTSRRWSDEREKLA